MLPELALLLGAVIAVTALLTSRFARQGSAFFVPDVPNARSLHERTVARSGGVAILAGILTGVGIATMLIAIPSWLIATAIALALVAAIGYRDDRYPVPALLRLCLHAIAAAVVAGSGISLASLELFTVSIEPGAAFNVVVSALFIMWMINLYNFMDGMDGLAGSMAVIGFGMFAIFGALANNTPFFVISAVIASAALGFLLFNLPPARIFMGDAGAYSLGLLAAVLTIVGVNENVFRLEQALLVFLPFIGDATYTLLSRLIRRRRVWDAHREHIYQRLVLSGMSHRKVLTIEVMVMLTCCGLSLL